VDDYTFKIDERDGKFWAVVCKTRPLQPRVHARRTTTQEEGPFDTHGAANEAGTTLRERFEKMKAFW
jgi:hypothetical protein